MKFRTAAIEVAVDLKLERVLRHQVRQMVIILRQLSSNHYSAEEQLIQISGIKASSF